MFVCSIAVAHTDGIFNPTANSVGDTQGIDSNAATGGGATCTPSAQAATFQARTPGLSPLETVAQCTLVNELVTAGAITGALSGAAGCGSVLDGFYWLATNTKANAYLNLCGTSFTLTEVAPISCTVDIGCAGNGSSGYLNTNWTPVISAINFTQSSASIGAYIQSTTASSSSVIMGTAAPGSFAYLAPVQAGNLFAEINGATFPAVTANANPQGAWVVSRTTSSLTSVYKNGSASAVGTNGDTSTSFASDGAMLLFALNNSGTPANFTNYQASCFFFGAGVTAAMAVAINNACNHAMTVLGPNHVY